MAKDEVVAFVKVRVLAVAGECVGDAVRKWYGAPLTETLFGALNSPRQ